MTLDLTNTVIPLVTETLEVKKRDVAAGTVTVRTIVEEVTEALQDAVTRQTVTVERVPVGRMVEAAPTMRVEGDTTIVPVIEERLVMMRQLFLIEEIHVRRCSTVEPVTLSATRLTMRAVVEHEDPKHDQQVENDHGQFE